MQHSDPKDSPQNLSSDEKVNSTVISWIKTLPLKTSNKIIKQLPPKFHFTRELLFTPVIVQKESCIFFNAATTDPDLFNTILDQTPTAILDEAITYAEPLNQLNTLHIVFSLNDEKMLSKLLQKISTAAFVQAVEVVIPEEQRLLLQGLISNKYKYFIEKVDSVIIDRWINSPLYMLSLLRSKNDDILLSIIQNSSTEGLNRCLSTGYIDPGFPWLPFLINNNSGFTKKTINALYQKLTDKTAENGIFLTDWDPNRLEILRSLYINGNQIPNKKPKGVNVTCNLKTLFFLSSISDALVLKLLDALDNDRPRSILLKNVALYNPAFFNALAHRLLKIEGTEFVYSQLTKYPLLITRFNESLINEFLIVYPEFREKIVDYILPENEDILKKTVHFFKEDKLEKRFLTTQLKIDDELKFLSFLFTYLTSTNIMIPPLARIVIDYCVSDPRLLDQITWSSKISSLEDKSEQTKSHWGPLTSLFSRPKNKAQNPSYQFLTESKGVRADTQLAENLLRQGQPLPDTLRPT